MNREIKFRAWDKDYNSFRYLELTNNREVSEELVVGKNRLPRPESYSKWMQYTGLSDKNGREIYEGDIVNQYGFVAKGIVEHGEYKIDDFSNHDRQHKHYGWHIKPIPNYNVVNDILSNTSYESLLSTQNGIEVIGNIYEHPELLKEDEE